MKQFLSILTLFVYHFCFGQLDSIHYLQPLIYANYNTSSVQYEFIFLSTPSTNEITVNVSFMGGEIPRFKYNYISENGVYSSDYISTNGTVRISNKNAVRIQFIDSSNKVLSPGNNPISRPLASQLMVIPANQGGVLFKSTSQFYVNYRALAASNGHALSMLTKGKYAIGKKFRWGGAPTLFKAGDANINNFLSVTALENNTKISLSGLAPNIAFAYNASSSWSTASTELSVNLNKGESVVFNVKLNGYNTNETINVRQRNGWFGASVYSDKDFIATVGGLMQQGGKASNADMGVEQIVPEDKLGKEHIVMKGLGTTYEKVYVIATEPNTEVKVNGVLKTTLSNPGNYYEVSGFGTTVKSMYIVTSKNAYVFHKNFGSTGAMTNNTVLIPPLSCNGQNEISFIPDASRINTTNFTTTTLFVLARAGDAFKPKVYINGSSTDEFSNAEVLSTSNSNWKIYSKKIGNSTNNVKNLKIQSNSTIQVQLLGANSNAGYGGYYSGFSTPPVLPIVVDYKRFDNACTGDTGHTLLKPITSNYSGSIQWYKNDTLIEGATSDTYKVPETDTEPAVYKMVITLSDGCSYYSESVESQRCPCTKQPNPNPGIVYPGIVGISTAENTDSNWPNNVNNAFLTLQSNNKGLVISRNPNPETTIENPQLGMIVYDTDDNCFKLYNGTEWKCLRKKCYDYDY